MHPTTPPDEPTKSPPSTEPSDTFSGLQAQVEHVRRTAMSAATRLLDARKAKGATAVPADTEELMCMIESMAKTPKKWGVMLMPYEKRAIAKWHTFRRLAQEMGVVET